MTIDRIFIAFMVVCGLAIAGTLIMFPQVAGSSVPPYFWVLIPMAIFEGISFAWAKGRPGSVIAMETRFAGFFIAVILMLGIPYLAGQPAVQIF